MPTRFHDSPSRRLTSPLGIAGMYLLLGALWILFSDRLVLLLDGSGAAITTLQTLKGWAFVVGTAALLYLALRRRQQALRESQRRLATLMGNLPGMAYRAHNDPDWTMTFVSEGCKPLTGYAPDELTGPSDPAYAQLIHPDDRDAVWDQVQAALTEQRPFELTYRIQTASGEQKWVWEQGQAVPSSDGGDSMLEGLIVDVTERKRYEQELVEAKQQAEEMNRLKSAFLSNMSHEIRTPLTAILGFADLLVDEVTDESREYIQLIRDSGERLQETLTSVMDLAQLEGGVVTMNPERFDLHAFVRETLRMFRSQAQRQDLSLELEAPPEKVPVEMDRAALRRVLTNLLSNALKFTSEGGVTVRLRATETHATLAVKDTGVGISRAFLPQVFDEFKQESEGLTRDYEGSGLGLSITKELVGLLSGTIDVESEKGQGTVFTVQLPRAPEASAPPVTPNPPPGTQESRNGNASALLPERVLVVEDNAATRQLIVNLLEEVPQVDLAADGPAALRQARDASYDLVLLDIALGTGPSGEKVLRELRALPSYTDTPIVALTAHAMPEDRERFLEAGFDGYLSKPFTHQQLVETVELAACLQERRAEQEAASEDLSVKELLARCKERGLIDDYERDEEVFTVVRDIASFRLREEQATTMLRTMLQKAS